MSTDGLNDTQIPDVLLDERYTNLERMAAGGMGAVYKAYDKHLDKLVAIKTMLVDQMTPDMILRFQQEARAASRLNHPNLITVLDFGMTEKNKPFLVMEFVEGDSLESRLNAGIPLPLDEAVWIISQICNGMSHAHKTGVIHRDLKPSNVMLLRHCRLGEPNVRIVDFGIAKIKDLFNTDERVTKTGAMLGSPFYISPEQINNSDVDPRADVYSLGCIMYRMFAGHPPFECDTYIETITAHLKQPVPEIPDDLELEIPPKLKSLVFRCLSKSPDERPQSMDALADELNTICGETEEILASGRFQLPNFDALTQKPAPRAGLSTKSKAIAGSTAALLLLVGAATIPALMEKRNARTVHKLKIQKRQFNPNAFVKEGKIIRSSSLCDDSDLEQLRDLNPQYLELTNATDATVKKLRELKLTSIKRIDLASTNITDACVDDLNSMSQLEYVSVEGTKITDAFAKNLRLKLKRLNLYSCKVGDESFIAISENLPTLRSVEASSTRITIKGIKALRKLPRLQNLGLSDLVIDNDVIEALKQMPELSSLTLTQAAMSTKILKRLPELKKLQTVELTKVQNADPKMVQWLSDNMPDCSVTSHGIVANKQMKDEGMEQAIDWLGAKGVSGEESEN